jgi:hypothetical protein
MQKINLEYLQHRATSLYNNIPCHISDPCKEGNTPLMGGMNIHLPILFTDGVKWLLRIRRSNATSPPPALQTSILQSEIATLSFLETTKLPTPKVLDYCLQGEEGKAGVSYILMEFMPGEVLDWSSISDPGREKVIAQLADVHIELGKHEFSAMGCLEQVGTKHIGPFARECFTDFTGEEGIMQPLGPFTHLQDYYHSCIDLLLELIHRGEVYADHPVETYLIHRYLYDKVSEIYPKDTEEEASKRFYLKHADDKGFHILVYADSNITGLIDWEWAFTAPKALAFNSPMLFLPTSEFFAGETGIGKDEEVFADCLEEKGAEDMARAVREGRVHHQVAFLCTLDFCLSFEDLLGLFKGLRRSVGVDGENSWEEWRKVAIERYEDDDRLREILERSGG